VYKGIVLTIPREVFHPGFFFSTKILLRYVARLALPEKNFLELGAGSGLISIFAAKQGAQVTASDINRKAIDFLEMNSANNHVYIRTILSDLFAAIPPKAFDIIAINPPYYKKQPRSEAEYAWFCGENGEYFERLFQSLPAYIHPSSLTLLTLCDGCDITMIRRMAKENGFELNCLLQKDTLIERNYLFRIEKKP